MKLPHVSTGAIFREEIAAESDLGKVAEGHIARGQLVPDEVVIKVIDLWMKNRGSAGFVFDGFPRTLFQGELFQGVLANRRIKLDAVIYLNASRAMVEDRILGRLVCDGCGRSYHVRRQPPLKEGICDWCGARLASRKDDNTETLNQRWKVFHKQTVGLVEFYRRLALLREVSAEGNAAEMCNHVWKALGA